MLREKAKVPLGRFANVGEIAEAICFLASPMSSYMSGASLVTDGCV
jgi:NAD(P)-dependent dehydrogenase (short-subunit alcohol dehydrogenase family)